MALRRRGLVELGRRLYGELVRGRSRVRIVPEAISAAATRPRFLLSPYRSGTTLVRYCLDSHPDLAVPPETDFLRPLYSVLQSEQSMTGFADLGYERGDVVSKLAAFGRGFLDAYAVSQSAGLGWLDKSPHYAEDPSFLPEVFGDARFLVLHRHPLDQINSFTRGGTWRHVALPKGEMGLDTIVEAARYWQRVTQGLLDFTATHEASTMSVRYEDLCDDPKSVMASVLEHLELPWSDNVTEYHRFDHDLGREAGRTAGTVGFSPTVGKWRDWPAEWADAAWSLVSDAATDIGYQKS